MDASELRFFRVCSPGPDAWISAANEAEAIETFCRYFGDEDRAELQVDLIPSDQIVNIPEEGCSEKDERTAAQWVAACNGTPTVVGHTEI